MALTPDEVIAANVRRFRQARGWSQETLAKTLTFRGHASTRHRILQMEGSRSDRSPSFSWSLLIALADLFDVTVFDLVLPDDETDVVAMAVEMPTGKSTFPGHLFVDVLKLDVESGGEMLWNRDEMAQQLFHLPGDWLASEEIAKVEGKLDRAYAADLSERLTRVAMHLKKVED